VPHLRCSQEVETRHPWRWGVLDKPAVGDGIDYLADVVGLLRLRQESRAVASPCGLRSGVQRLRCEAAEEFLHDCRFVLADRRCLPLL